LEKQENRMKKREYMFAHVLEGKVIHVNGKSISNVSPMNSLLGVPIKGEKALDFLNRMGLEGWEIINWNSGGGYGDYYLLKRPIP
jgi:hypothetical protein